MKRPDWLTAANGFTGFRFVCAGMTVEALLNGRLFGAFIWGLVGLLTDFFDGMFAKRGWLGGASEFGKILDPIADKVMTFFPTTSLAAVLLLAGYLLEGIALIVALLIVACREIIVALTKKQLARLEGLLRHDCQRNHRVRLGLPFQAPQTAEGTAVTGGVKCTRRAPKVRRERHVLL